MLLGSNMIAYDHACCLYTDYHYDIDFLSCDRQMEERNEILYDSYRDLVNAII